MISVLIVDDEKSIRRTLGEFLRADGYNAVEAEDAETALQRLGETEFDVVVTDIVLPKVSGVELLRRIQSIAPQVQVVMMTGEPTVETATESLRAGAADYLFKPINKAAILKAVTHAARIKSLADDKRKLEAENQAYQDNLEQLVKDRTAQWQRSEARFRALVETTLDWVWEADEKGRFQYVSPQVVDLLGYSPDEVLGRTPFDFMSETKGPPLREIAARREPFRAIETVHTHKNGRRVILETSAVPVFDENKVFKGYRGMGRDITVRKRLEEELRQSQKLEGVGQLAGGIAHDFNNILAAIMMQLGLLQLNTALDEATQGALEEISREAERATNLTRQLLMFSRRAVLDVKPVNLDEIVDGLLKMLRRLIGEHIKIELGHNASLPLVGADPGMIEQVVLNLVVNARDAMPKGGTITLTTSASELSESDVASGANRRPGHFVILSVNDTGIGMPPDILPKIFDPFFTTKPPGKGTGLGLSTVHGIVTQHLGWVEVESRVKQGTTFRIYLPVLDASQTKPTPQPPSKKARGTETLLVVEDQPEVRRLTSRILRAHGYHVHEVSDGHEAIALWQKVGADIQLLFTDMVMPNGMTGLELADHLRALKPSLKVLITSGYSSEFSHMGAIENASITYLQKPYQRDHLLETVRKCLDLPIVG